MHSDPEGPRIPDGQSYVVCNTCKSLTLVPLAQARAALFAHMDVFPEHREVARSDSAGNFAGYILEGYRQVTPDVFTPIKPR